MTKNERINLRLTAETKEALRAAAEADGRTITNYIEWLIIKDLNAKKGPAN